MIMGAYGRRSVVPDVSESNVYTAHVEMKAKHGKGEDVAKGLEATQGRFCEWRGILYVYRRPGFLYSYSNTANVLSRTSSSRAVTNSPLHVVSFSTDRTQPGCHCYQFGLSANDKDMVSDV